MTFRKTEYKEINMRKKKSMVQITKVLTTGALVLALAPGFMPAHMVAAETVTETVKEVNSTDKENEKRTKKADSSANLGENAGEESKDSTTAEDITSGSVDESEDIQPSSDDSSADSDDNVSSANDVVADVQDGQDEDPAVPTEEEEETKEKKWYHVSIIDVAAQLTFAFVVALIGYGIFVRSKK